MGMENVEGDYLDGLTLDSVCSALDPETDFYLDDNGNITSQNNRGSFVALDEEVLAAISTLKTAVNARL